MKSNATLDDKNNSVLDLGMSEQSSLDSSQTQGQTNSLSLISTIGEMKETLGIMHEIIQKANFIALNASIEAARTQSQSENFSLVADQVRRQAEKTFELAKSLDSEISRLLDFAFRARAVNLTDIANDIIDKIDRNLFERNCDMQAWAGFKETVTCAKLTFGKTQEDVATFHSEKSELPADIRAAMVASSDKQEVLVDIYQVYLESILVNDQGVVVAAAKNKELIGNTVTREKFYQHVMKKGTTYVSEMSYDELILNRTVAYTAPVRDENGKVIGMVSNSFNWDMIQDMVDKLPVSSDARVFVISRDGTVIGSLQGRGVLQDHLTWLRSGELALDGLSGYTIETARNGRLSAWGFCHTFGYNAYPGKGWSAVVSHPVEVQGQYFLSQEIARDPELKRQASHIANEQLKRCSDRIHERVSNINTINNETNMLAVNAAIQAGVAGAEGEAFSVIASEIGQLARQSEDFVSRINTLSKALGGCVRSTVYTRLGEAAFDTIDKIDRNLFERNCDIKAFASFDEIRNFQDANTDRKELTELLRRLHEIYEVYHDIFLLDLEGNVVASAIHRELVGQNQGDRSWFRECVSGHLVVSDLYHSKSINDYTVTFAAPVKAANGTTVGVLTTRFNCSFLYDIMKSTIVGKGSEVFLVNSKGLVIGSPTGEGILEQSLTHLKAYRASSREPHGYVLEQDSAQGGVLAAIGFSKTQGYLNYQGKGWSVLIRTPASDDE